MKEKLLERRSNLVTDKRNLENSSKALYFVYDACIGFNDLVLGREYTSIIVRHIDKEIQEIDKKLGI